MMRPAAGTKSPLDRLAEEQELRALADGDSRTVRALKRG